ncbi:E2 ubiquitin-conjugating enzyme [Ascochyta rabiei]|uniref:E2 ubiquitin-conjugating enzyme n=1 Tax=Didymella rabiei TaxID=5454 RepID=UPI0019013732|nr:E2 ubiquitin-conjugating enzyme [Ascochyta rabiei]UPX13408.1 E2 ubiquitin-conjugating enzyme [Ascochyta rabiei]
MALARIAQEHADLQRDPLETCFAGPTQSDNPRRWAGHITGPSDTPYEHRDYSIAIVFPEDYPIKPFQITFTTPLSHPNVSVDGEVRLAELEEKHWSPVLTVRSILISLQALLSGSPNYAQEHNVDLKAVEGSTEPTHDGRKIGGKKYGMDISRPEFKEYSKLTDVEERNKFFIKHADIV